MIFFYLLFSGHPGISVNKLSPLSLRRWNIHHFKFDFHRLKMADSLLLEEVTSPRKRELYNYSFYNAHILFCNACSKMTHTKIKIMNSFLIRVAWVSWNTSLFFQVCYIFVFCFRSFVCCFSSFDIVCLFLASLFF